MSAENHEIRFYRAVGPYACLSNLFRRKMIFEDKEFSCSEAAYQFGKPKKNEVAEWIISAPAPHLIAAISHALFVFDVRPDWKDTKVERMERVLYAKFSQHADLREILLSTGDAELIEESKTDAFWGTGKRGTGLNMLGKLLMKVRARLREEFGS